MRFFRFLHRRTKSDSAIPNPTPTSWDNTLHRPKSLDAAQTALFATACPQTFLYPTPADTSNTIFELQTTNTRLQNDLAICQTERQQFRVQLDTIHADLFTQLYQNSLLQRQIQKDRLEMEETLNKLAKYERFLNLMINIGLHQRVLGDAHAALRAGVDPDAALVDAIKDAAAIPGSPWSTIIPSVTGPRTQEEYRASLSMTLKARRELRDIKKIAKYWKQLALESSQVGTVTPSVSSISSIHEPLPPDRQKAVDELISARRRASLPTVEPPQQDTLSGISCPTEPSTQVETDVSAVPLSPLASESFKSELATVSNGSRLFKRLPHKPNRVALGQIDSNIPPSTKQGYSRSKSGLKQHIHQPKENLAAFQQDDDFLSKPRQRPRELAIANVVPSFSKHSLCSTHLGPLGRIEEEHDEFPPTRVTESEDNDQESWSLVEHPDSSFQTVTPTKASRLPKPVLRQLNRLSLTKTESLVVAPLVIRKKSTPTASVSPTRLPVSMQGKRTIVRR